MLTFLFRHVARFLVMTLVTLVIVVALLSGLLRLGMPYASSYKYEIQAWVSNYLRSPVELGSIDLRWRGFSPSLELKEVTLQRKGDQRVELKLDEILLDLNLYKSVFTGAIQINEVTLAGVDLALEYVGKQQFKISGYQLPGGAGSASTESSIDVAPWLMNADRVGLLNSRIRVVDSKRGIDYQIDNLDISAENTSRLHRLRLSMDLPAQLGKSLQIDIDLNGSSDELHKSSGRFYAAVSGMNLQNWMRIWPQRPLAVAGDGDIEFWGNWADRQLLSVRSRMQGADVRLAEHQSADARELHYPALSTDIFWQRGANGWRAEIDKLDFSYAGSETRIRKALVAAEKNQSGDRLTLGGQGQSLAIAAVADLLGELGQSGLPESIASYARQAQFNGELQNWQLQGTLEAGQVPRLSMQGKLVDVGSTVVQGIPGVQNLSGRFALHDSQGQIELDSRQLQLDIPRLFSRAISIEQATGLLALDLTAPAQLLRSEALSLQNQGVTALSSFVLGRDSDDDWHIDLQSAAEMQNIADAVAYLPDRKLPRQVSAWLEQALVQGRARSASLLMFGKLRDFPYSGKPGLFEAEIMVDDATLKFLPDWPVGSQLRGSVVFAGRGLRFSLDQGVFSGTQVSRLDGEIDNLRKPLLKLSGASNGSLQSFIDFSNNGPLSKILSPAFEQASGSGEAVINLELSVPLRPKAKRPPQEVLTLDGTVFLADNLLDFKRFDVALDKLTGAVSFSESGLHIDNLSALYLAAPIKIKARSLRDDGGASTELTAQGLLRADKVLSHFKIPVHSFFNGAALWQVALNIPLGPTADPAQPERKITLRATSDLIGTEVFLPPPMAKNTATTDAVVVQGVFDKSGAQSWRVENQSARLRLQAEPEQGLRTLNIALGQEQLKSTSSAGIYIDGISPELSFDGWIEAVSRIIDELPEADPGKPEPVLPVYADVGAVQMIVGKSRMGAARFRVNSDETYINAVMNSTHLRGSIRIPRAHWDKDQAIKTRIAYADSLLLDALADADDQEAGKLLDPTRFPRLEAHISRFVYKTLTLRNLGLRAEPDAAGMKITALGFANEDAQLIGEGSWHLSDPQRLNPELAQSQQTHLTLNLQSSNIGQTLQRAGYASVLAEGQGEATIKLNWAGAAYKPELATMKGEATLSARDGRILKIDPGAARLVGLIALQELPRRLSLDFRDLVKDGLDFKRISGNFTLAEGKAQTDILRLEGPIGVIEIQGESNLIAQTFDQRIRVLPRISAALPIIAILSGGASAGVGALLVSPVLKAFGLDIDRIGLTEYSLSGSWDEPLIESVTRAPERFDNDDND